MTAPINYRLRCTPYMLDGCQVAAFAVDRAGESAYTAQLYKRTKLSDGEQSVVRELIIFRHFLLHSKVEIFKTDLELNESDGRVIDMYIISRNRVGFLTINDDSKLFQQHLIELIPPEILLKERETSHRLTNEGIGLTTVVRRIRLDRLKASVTISFGQLYSTGRILLAGKRSEEFSFRSRGDRVLDTVELLQIAADPLETETKPDRDLSNEARRLWEEASSRDLIVLPGLPTFLANGDIQFMLLWVEEQIVHVHTSSIALLVLQPNGKYDPKIIDGIESGEMMSPEMLSSDFNLSAASSGNATTYFTFLLNDIARIQTWSYKLLSWWHQFQLHLIRWAVEIANNTRQIFGTKLTRFLVWMLLRIYGQGMRPTLENPAKSLTFAYNSQKRAYRKIDDLSRNIDLSKPGVHTRRAASEKELLQATYPCWCREKICRNYVVRSIGDPFIAPTLSRLAQSVISSSLPSVPLFTARFRRELGLADALETTLQYRYFV